MKQSNIYVIRHGECEGNVSKRILDPFIDSLTEVGKAQAERLGAHLKKMSISQFFSSDYLRADQTAQIVLDEFCFSETGIKLVNDKRLRERDCSGTTGDESTTMQACETINQFEARIISFFSQLVQNVCTVNDAPDQQNILVFSHGFTIQRLMCLLNSSFNDFGIHKWTTSQLSEKLMKNASYHKIVLKTSLDSGNADNILVHGSVECAQCRDYLDSL